ncbi:MAG: hypothetical protein HOC71_08840, partial [Candidatus Latescibacteria bacterium]|nr:hypothetical protein [Candidatus Latescibacterota bacterium]
PLSEVVYKRADTQEPVEDFKDVRWRVIDETENLTERLVKDRYGTELFSLFMILAAGLFAVEMALSRKV